MVKKENLVPFTTESREVYGKPRRKDSKWKDLFARAMTEIDASPNLAFLMPQIGSFGEESILATQDLAEETPSTLEFVCHRTTVKRIPKASRLMAAKALTKVVQGVIDANDSQAWLQFLHFAGQCLGKPKRGGKKTSVATAVKRQIRNFEEGTSPFTEDSLNPPRRGKPRNIAKKVSEKLSMGDVKGAVRLLASSDKILEANLETLAKLQEKHPEAHPESVFPEAPEIISPMTATRDDVRLAIKSFKKGSAGGHDGLLAQHLLDLTADELGSEATKLLDTLRDFINVMVFGGQIPDEICPIFFGANLIAFSKEDGGVRPIAVGLTMRRLAGKIAMSKLRPACSTLLHPHQLGVCMPKGSETAAHVLRRFLDHSHEEQMVIFKIDFRNAFNTVRRDEFLRQVKKHFPQLFPFAWQSYGKPSNLYFGDNHVILSKEGCHQGDPLGPLLFAMGIKDLINNCNSKVKLFYMDDGTLAGRPEEVLADLEKIKAAANSLGLELNTSKCELFIKPHHEDNSDCITAMFEAAAPEVKILSRETLTLLGAPIAAEAIDGVLQSKLEDLKVMMSKLEGLDSQVATFLLRHCLAIPKMTYFLRSAPCFESRERLLEYDTEMRKGLEGILNGKISEDVWDQSILPVSTGGLGIRKASDLAVPAFIASAHGSMALSQVLLPTDINNQEYQQLSAAEELWKEMVSPDALQPSDKNLQAKWDEPIYNHQFTQLLDRQDSPEEKARLLAVNSEQASAWLNAIPIPSLGLKLDNTSFRICCGLRLGFPICQPHKCPCGNLVDSSGRHGLSCNKAAGRHSRHKQANDLIGKAIASADVPVAFEPLGLSPTDNERPDGMSLFPWSQGKILVWDFTCSDTLAWSHVISTSKEAGKSAQDAEKEKQDHYHYLLQDYIFTPVAAETMGSWGPIGLKFIKDLGTRIKEKTGERRSTAYLFQSLGMAIQRGNAASVIGTLPRNKKLDEIYLL